MMNTQELQHIKITFLKGLDGIRQFYDHGALTTFNPFSVG
jgi:hypothetical protein